MSSDYPKSKQIKSRDKQVNRELKNFGEQSQGEIEIHKPQITEVCTKDSKPLAKKHEKSPEIAANLNSLTKSWNNIERFEEARGIIEWTNADC